MADPTTAPAEIEPNLATAAATVGFVIADLKTIPNQPLTFRDEGTPRSEDAIIAYSWNKFLRGGSETWPAFADDQVRGSARWMR